MVWRVVTIYAIAAYLDEQKETLLVNEEELWEGTRLLKVERQRLERAVPCQFLRRSQRRRLLFSKCRRLHRKHWNATFVGFSKALPPRSATYPTF